MAEALDKLHSKDFSEHLNSKFKAHLHNGEFLTLELLEVIDRETAPNAELFLLIFRGPQSPRLIQSIHRLEHDKMGILEIFLTSIGATPEGISYEAVFHRASMKA
jgi:hypothetical protein